MKIITDFKSFLNEAEEPKLPPNKELSKDKNYVLMDADKYNLFEVAKFRKWLNEEKIPYEKFVDNKYSGFELQSDDADILKKVKDKVEADHKLLHVQFK